MLTNVHIFLMKRAVRRLAELSRDPMLDGTRELNESDKNKILIEIVKALFLMSPVIAEGLLLWSLQNCRDKLGFPVNHVYAPYGSFWLSVTNFLYSKENFESVFKPIVGDWREEAYDAIKFRALWKIRWLHVRYTFIFLTAMWQKSPFGDLIEFVVKIAKQ